MKSAIKRRFASLLTLFAVLFLFQIFPASVQSLATVQAAESDTAECRMTDLYAVLYDFSKKPNTAASKAWTELIVCTAQEETGLRLSESRDGLLLQQRFAGHSLLTVPALVETALSGAETLWISLDSTGAERLLLMPGLRRGEKNGNAGLPDPAAENKAYYCKNGETLWRPLPFQDGKLSLPAFSGWLRIPLSCFSYEQAVCQGTLRSVLLWIEPATAKNSRLLLRQIGVSGKTLSGSDKTVAELLSGSPPCPLQPEQKEDRPVRRIEHQIEKTSEQRRVLPGFLLLCPLLVLAFSGLCLTAGMLVCQNRSNPGNRRRNHK